MTGQSESSIREPCKISFRFKNGKQNGLMFSLTLISRMNSLCDEETARLGLRCVGVSQGHLIRRQTEGIIFNLSVAVPTPADPTKHRLLGAVHLWGYEHNTYFQHAIKHRFSLIYLVLLSPTFTFIVLMSQKCYFCFYYNNVHCNWCFWWQLLNCL